ncbi:uncharacterized protein LY89DRAFT_743395 [Mollisia scopiformis]|uniref:Uncharacterized protein n=1 Tax=Mollisia scopiformis TaxID=149040 RepID=A0A132B500_MOLSC|nr:uncharacterized protein LY89DRAFT_743395 [Mollisia scopiformis]KUJ07069.1 hypothetical protein LY89DRAFT_743395 [Mollisia scopiformis]
MTGVATGLHGVGVVQILIHLMAAVIPAWAHTITLHVHMELTVQHMAGVDMANRGVEHEV